MEISGHGVGCLRCEETDEVGEVGWDNVGGGEGGWSHVRWFTESSWHGLRALLRT